MKSIDSNCWIVPGLLVLPSGLVWERGLFLAAIAGIVTPAGPFVSMPLAVGLLRLGAACGRGDLLASWSLLAAHRLFAWEVPILGASFAFTRWSLCLVLPIAGSGEGGR